MEKKRKKRIDAFAIVVIILTVIALLLIGGVLYFVQSSYSARIESSITDIPFIEEFEEETKTPIPNPNPTATPAPEDREMPELDGKLPTIKSQDGNPIPEIFDAVSSSVVGVVNYQMQSYGKQNMMGVYGTGSGFIVSSSGYILTNAHVVEDAQKVAVRFSDGEEYDAVIIGTDEDTDVAVIKIEAKGLKAVAIGDSDTAQVGEYVLAIGSPLDLTTLSNTLTHGILSAVGRSITIDGHTNEYLQTDAAINFGNSGGPLLNMNGEVIGMNSAKSVYAGYDSYGNAVNAEGIGFALPINTVVEIMEKLITNGTIDRPALGVTIMTLDETTAAALDLKQGVLVESVVKGSPAADAGVKTGDIILKANGQNIVEKEDLINIVNQCEIGDTITLLVDREGTEVECVVHLGNKTGMDFNDIETE